MLEKDGNVTTLLGPFSFFWTVLSKVIKARLELVHGGFEMGTELGPGNWTGAIGQLMNQEVDAMVTPSASMPEMDGYVRFSTPFDLSSQAILSGPPQAYSQRGSSVFASLGLHVQVCFFVSWVLISVLYYLFKVESAMDHHSHEDRRSFVKILLSFYGLLFKIGFRNPPMHTGRRILLTSWLLSTFILMTMLAGSMYSRLAVTDVPERIETLEDIVRRPELKPLIARGLILDTHLQTSATEVKQAVWKQVLRHDSLCDLADLFDPLVMDEVYDGKAVIITNKQYLVPVVVGMSCYTVRRLFYVSKTDLIEQPTCFVYRLGLDPAVAEAFNLGAAHIGGMGLMQKGLEDTTRNSFPCLEQSMKRTSHHPLGLRELSQAFVVLGIGFAFSLVVFFYEICWPPYASSL